jgi:signal transduction histidine kinase
MMNLLSNAAKFTESGEVIVKMHEHSREIIVSVKDTGVGIEPADYDRVFDKFKQVNASQNTKPSGTGLGLPISREIIERHGGRIWFESEAGQGTTFSFTLNIDRR